MKYFKLSTKVTALIVFLILFMMTIFIIPNNTFAIGINYTSGVFTTKYGAKINVMYLDGSDDTQDKHNTTDYPSASKIGGATCSYNCFTYALILDGNIDHVTRPEVKNRLFCMNDITKLLVAYNKCFQKVSFANVRKGDIVLYKVLSSQSSGGTSDTFYVGYNHCAIVEQKGVTIDSTIVKSKWGQGAVYQHNIFDNPYVAGCDIVTGQNSINAIEKKRIEISFVRFSHSYEVKGEIMLENPLNAITSKSYCHKVECKDCGVFHFENHQYIANGNNMICKLCGYVSDIILHSVYQDL